MLTFATQKTRPARGAPPPSQHARLRRMAGIRAILHSPGLQPKLKVGAVNDPAEAEADRVADQVMRMPEPTAACAPSCPPSIFGQSGSAPVRRLCADCEEKMHRKPAEETVQRMEAEEDEELIRTKEAPGAGPSLTAGSESAVQSLRGGGSPLTASERAFFEPRFGRSFEHVRIHHGPAADGAAKSINARAFTFGRDIAFAREEFRPGSPEGHRLMAHELAHTMQQGSEQGSQTASPVGSGCVQRTLGDGHDLTSPRFSSILDLEAAYDDETVLRDGSTGRGVQAIQQALYDLGFSLPASGADGRFGSETKKAVEAFQRANPPLNDDGEVGHLTMTELDARFAAPVLPAPAARSAPWTEACVRSILCPWSPHTVDVLRARITLKSFDNISWADEEWDGAAWIPAPFPGGGYNTGTEIGVLNSSCEEMTETLYHEVLHAEQPTSHKTTREREVYAYRIGEEFSIALGLGGRQSLRSTDAQGRQFADPAKVGAFVASAYPSVPAGPTSDEIIGKAAAAGHVRVQRPDGTIYTRAAAVGEKVPGPISLVNEVTHPTAGWTCP